MAEQTQYPSLKARTVLITGGASGIGADLVSAFAQQGSRCVFIDIQDDAGNALANRLGNDVFYQHCDLTHTEQLKAAVDNIVEQHGPISVLVNNAGDDTRRPVEKIDTEFWAWSQAINVQAQFFMAQAVLPSMKSSMQGSIINLSSIAWQLGIPELTAYATAKAGIIGLTNTLAADFGQYNIRVNAIEPGAVMTEKQRRLWYQSENDVQQMVNRQKLNRVLVGDDIAKAALFLASNDSSMITGQSIKVDAGFR